MFTNRGPAAPTQLSSEMDYSQDIPNEISILQDSVSSLAGTVDNLIARIANAGILANIPQNGNAVPPVANPANSEMGGKLRVLSDMLTEQRLRLLSIQRQLCI